MTGSAHDLVRRHERSLPAARRRRLGAHYTPPVLARRLVVLALDALGGVPATVVDPCCGAGSFLLAVADELVARGVPAADVPARLHGADVDAGSLAAARRALAAWAAAHGVRDPAPPRLVRADTLLAPPGGWAGGFDLVVGNPPFLSQLSGDTARTAADRAAVAARFPGVGPYTDAAGLFLLGAADLLAAGGVAVLVQPQSLLSARDAAPVRAAVVGRADLVGLWADDRDHFDASVRVCAPVLRRIDGPSGGGDPRRGDVEVRWRDDAPRRGPRPDAGASWGPLLAPSLGVPDVAPAVGGPTLSSLASATAGFRDEFYAIAAATRDAGDPRWSSGAPRVATVGLVDAGHLAWGRRPARIAGRSHDAPRVDLDALADGRRTARWVAGRLRPKVLVATQTKVVEAAADPVGDVVPLTPLISVEPHDAEDLWRVAAALLAPPVAARAAGELIGTGRSTGAVRWSARRVLDVPLPLRRERWDAAARLLAAAHDADLAGDGTARSGLLLAAGAAMCEAHDVDAAHPVLDWWAARAVGGP